MSTLQRIERRRLVGGMTYEYDCISCQAIRIALWTMTLAHMTKSSSIRLCTEEPLIQDPDGHQQHSLDGLSS